MAPGGGCAPMAPKCKGREGGTALPPLKEPLDELREREGDELVEKKEEKNNKELKLGTFYKYSKKI